jgi:hypothetical protein
LAEVIGKKSLKADDPLLERALREFPENSLVLAIALSLKEGADEKLLVQAIKAEYRRFSVAGLVPRPSARPLRSYFQRLAKTFQATAMAVGQ